jgi:hypothetical protein
VEGNEFAFRFTAGSTLLLDYADLRLATFRTLTGNVSVLTNGADNRPATLLESVAVSFPHIGFPVVPMPLTRIEFSNTVLLTAGTFYWLAVSPATAEAGIDGFWDSGGLPIGTDVWDQGAIGPTDPWDLVAVGVREGGMRIFGVAPAAVPEPSTYGLVASTLLAAIATLRRRLRK